MIKIIWDWNGTLLDDTALSLQCIQQVQREYGVRPFENLDEYRSVFGFPVCSYYQKAGFDFSRLSWPEVGARFMELYLEGVSGTPLAEDALDALELSADLRMAGFVLSATRQDLLKEQIMMHPRLSDYLYGVYGIGDIYASSKESAAKELLAACLPDDILFLIGDTVHDQQIAEIIGAQFIAVPRGHQPAEAFEKGTVTAESLVEAVRWIDARTSD